MRDQSPKKGLRETNQCFHRLPAVQHVIFVFFLGLGGSDPTFRHYHPLVGDGNFGVQDFFPRHFALKLGENPPPGVAETSAGIFFDLPALLRLNSSLVFKMQITQPSH